MWDYQPPAWFPVVGLLFMLAALLKPQWVLFVMSLGRVREVEPRGVAVLRWIAGLSALGFLVDLLQITNLTRTP